MFLDHNFDKSSFIPSLIFKKLTEKATESQCIWAIGNTLFSYLKSEINNYSHPSLIQIYNQKELERKRKIENNYEKAFPFIYEMQSSEMYKILVLISKAVKEEKPIKSIINENIIKSIFGKDYNSLIDYPNFPKILYKNVMEIGQNSFKKELIYYETNLIELDPSSPDGRTLFFKRYEKTFSERELLFTDFQCNNISLKSLELTKEIINEFLLSFTGLIEKYKKFINIFLEGKHDIDLSIALSIYYFYKIAELIEKSDYEENEIKQIPNLCFNEEPPFKLFDRNQLSNIDILLKQFAKNMIKIKLTSFEELTFNENLIFHIEISNGTSLLISHGCPNLFL